MTPEEQKTILYEVGFVGRAVDRLEDDPVTHILKNLKRLREAHETLAETILSHTGNPWEEEQEIRKVRGGEGEK